MLTRKEALLNRASQYAEQAFSYYRDAVNHYSDLGYRTARVTISRAISQLLMCKNILELESGDTRHYLGLTLLDEGQFIGMPEMSQNEVDKLFSDFAKVATELGLDWVIKIPVKQC